LSTTPSSAPPLARRLTRRAVDLFVVAFLVMVGLSVGRQLIDWWRTDPAEMTPDLSSLNAVDLDWSRTPVTLQFGNAPTSLERIPFHGGRKQLEEELTRIGQSIVTTTDPSASPVDDAELGWLAALSEAPPVFWDSTRGNVYRRHEPLPSFVATRYAETVEGAAQQDTGSNGQRIVGWGLAFPSAPDDWTIYVFHPNSAKPALPDSTQPQRQPVREAALPDGARNITTLRGSDGCVWQVFEGRGELARWVQHFDEQYGTNARLSRVVGTQTAGMKYRRDRTVADVQIRTEPDGRLTGVIWSALEREMR
jgi:hypothetical protein